SRDWSSDVCSSDLDYRPYFTVHNSDFQEFSKMGDHQAFKSVIIGVTNPYFIKALDKWPHVIAIGKQFKMMNKTQKKPLSRSHKDVMTAMFNINGSVDEQKKKLLWEFEEMFCTKYNFIFEDDGTLEKRVLSLDKNDKHR